MSTPTPPPPPTLPVRSGSPADHTRIQNADPHPVTLPSAPAQVPLPDGTPFGRYRLVDRLGEGGMGVVWKAWDGGLHRWVALKQIRGGAGESDSVERFLREARLAARLRHPGIVPVYDVGEHGGQPFFTAEWIDGRALSDRPHARLAPEEAVPIVAAVAEALAYAHEQGVIHRDVKPANVLLDARGTPFVTDFGLARDTVLQDSGGARPLTQSGSLVGTPGYMSPEQASGRRAAVGPAADQFSLGVVLYELLTGRVPFAGEGLRDVLNAITEHEPVAPRALDPRIPRDLETICLRALEKDPVRRYPSMRALAEDLRRFAAGEAIAARPYAGFVRRLQGFGRRRATALAALAVLLGVALAGAYLFERLQHTMADADAARRQAGEAEAAAREILGKAALVSKVLARWSAVVPAVRVLERTFYDRGRPIEAIQAAGRAPWVEVEGFLNATPADPTSQAVARALAGWARRLAGYEEEGLAWMRQSTALDPDTPYGRLMEALAIFSDYAAQQALPDMLIGGGRVRFGAPPGERAELAHTREAISMLLQAASTARVWGKEGADDVAEALDAIRAWQAGRYADAEAALSRTLQAPDLRAFETGLRLARAQVRYLQQKLPDARADLASVLAANPDRVEVHNLNGLFLQSAAEETARNGGDPRPQLQQAIDAFHEALRRSPEYFQALNNRAGAYAAIGWAEMARGRDPRPWYEKAIADDTEALGWNPGFIEAWSGRGSSLTALGQALSRRGEDPQTLFVRGLSDLDEAVRRAPDRPATYCARADLRLMQSEFQTETGNDPAPLLRLAIADLDRAAQDDPGNPAVYDLRSQAHQKLARAESARGEDARAALERALADARACLERDPQSTPARVRLGEALHARADAVSDDREAREELLQARAALDEAIAHDRSLGAAWSGRAGVWRSLGYREARQRLDPRPSYASSIDDYGHALACNPEESATYYDRGNTYLTLSEAEVAAGVDACASAQRAVDDYTQALARNPVPVLYLEARGDAYVHRAEAEAACGRDPQESFALARTDLETAVRRAGSAPDAWANLGFAREFQGDLEAAVDAYERALQLDPDSRHVRVGLPRARYNLACRYALRAAGKDSKTAAPRALAPEEAKRERDLALEMLRKAVEAGWTDAAHTETDPDLEALRDDPRWRECLERMKK